MVQVQVRSVTFRRECHVYIYVDPLEGSFKLVVYCRHRVLPRLTLNVITPLSRVTKMAPVINKTFAVLAVAGIGVLGYAIYFDHKRRTDAQFRKRLRMLNP